jgi:hypothetical protein
MVPTDAICRLYGYNIQIALVVKPQTAPDLRTFALIGLFTFAQSDRFHACISGSFFLLTMILSLF